MPLLKRKPFSLSEPPKDLEPCELVYQVRFTKEVFRDYHAYLNHINLYRQRIWTCKVTGKTGLTYEEALVSEKRGTEKIQQFPKELMAPALRIIQYSMLPLRDLADAIAEKLQECVFVGAELYGKKDNGEYLCKILKILEEGVKYEVAWLDKNKKTIEKEEVNQEDLEQKKPPFSREVLKSFIRESTYRNAPWVLHDELARYHGISTDIPGELKDRAFFKNGLLICNRKRKIEELKGEAGNCKSKKLEGQNENGHLEEPKKYPIDDLLVKPGPDDPVFTDRPSPSRDFNVPMDCVGDLLMVWDFCLSFGRLLHLSPFSLEDFENAICHKDSNLVLLVESHAALLGLLIRDNGDYFVAVQKRKRKMKITMITWTDYLCDFLEMINIPELCHYESTIKRGHYGLVDAQAKLGFFREMINQALETAIIREKLDEFIEQRQELGSTRRGQALEEAKKRREEKERLKDESMVNGGLNKHDVVNVLGNNSHSRQNGNIAKKGNGKAESSRQGDASEKSASKHSNPATKKTSKRSSFNVKEPAEDVKESSRTEPHEQLNGDNKETSERISKEQRREYFEREMEKRLIRTNPLGKDRDYKRYWWFRRDGRVFVESPDSKEWGYYSTKEELDALMGSLNCKGERERALRKQLEKYYNRICLELQKKSKELAHKIAEDEAIVRRSTRVRAPPRENPANAFLRYVNKWKECGRKCGERGNGLGPGKE
ncbi:DDT domain-containing protein [Quillaja saponaria]|uniref:DDT domain-containing protein n=1 Tax=Quillaja saponaria TaxID=32244 RepID=A0AAD7LF91_QUISA|nr:DDT domain-containing protein [Quillaja saponaria]